MLSKKIVCLMLAANLILSASAATFANDDAIKVYSDTTSEQNNIVDNTNIRTKFENIQINSEKNDKDVNITNNMANSNFNRVPYRMERAKKRNTATSSESQIKATPKTGFTGSHRAKLRKGGSLKARRPVVSAMIQKLLARGPIKKHSVDDNLQANDTKPRNVRRLPDMSEQDGNNGIYKENDIAGVQAKTDNRDTGSKKGMSRQNVHGADAGYGGDTHATPDIGSAKQSTVTHSIADSHAESGEIMPETRSMDIKSGNTENINELSDQNYDRITIIAHRAPNEEREKDDIKTPSQLTIDYQTDYKAGFEVSNREEALQLLDVLQIMDKNMSHNDLIKRSELAKIAVCALGLQDMVYKTEDKHSFRDVNNNHWANKFIRAAKSQKLLEGYNNREFKPDDNMKFSEVLDVMIRILGYKPAADNRGGFPDGYIAVAAQNGLLNGIDTSFDNLATRGDVAQLLFNAMTVNMMEPSEYSANMPYKISEKTILKDILGIEKKYGIVNANAYTSLSSPKSELNQGQIMIDDKVYCAGDSKAEKLLGYSVAYYYKHTDDSNKNTVVLAIPEKNKNNPKMINSCCIESVVQNSQNGEITLKYWDDKETSHAPKSLTISSKASLIYNGQYEDLNVTDMKPTSGNLTLIDTKGTGEYDVVFANWFENMVMGDSINCLSQNCITHGMDINFDTMDYVIMLNDMEIKSTDLKPWNVLSVARNNYRKDGKDLKVVKIYASDQVVIGMVLEKYDDKYIINGREYELASNCNETVQLNQSGIFYLDVEGKIAAINWAQNSLNSNYAYMLDAAADGIFGTTVHFKLFNMKGEVVILKSAPNVRVNNKFDLDSKALLKNSSLSSEGKVTQQLVTYETNSSGEIVAIYTANKEQDPNDKFTRNLQNRYTYNAFAHKLGDININERTVVFDIPASANGDSTKFAVRNIDTFVDNGAYDVSVYDLSEDYTARAVVITNADISIANTAPIAIVEKVTETKIGQTVVDKLYALKNGSRIAICASGKNVLMKPTASGTTTLDQGDIIRYQTNANREIDVVEVLFDADSSKLETEFDNTSINDLELIYGKVEQKFGSSINVVVNEGKTVNYPINGTRIYEYNHKRPHNSVRVANYSDICSGECGQRIFMKVYNGVVQEIVIIR